MKIIKNILKNRIQLFLLAILSFISCEENKKEAQIINDLALYDTNKTNQIVKIDNEPKILQEEGIFGIWDCNFTGYESLIYLKKIKNNYSSIIQFKKKYSIKRETLYKKGNKYFVSGSTAKEYYMINTDGALELWDKEGFFTVADKFKFGQVDNKLNVLNLNETVNKNIFTIAGNLSKSFPKTLEGTDNEFWIVYYKDINVTFKVDKMTKNIIKYKVDEIPNLK